MEKLSYMIDKSYVQRSYERCRQMGISVSRVYSTKIISGQELQQKLEEERELILTASPFMDQLYKFVKGSNFFAILTNGEGCILNVIGDNEILSQAFEFKMVPGAYMDEENIGTNAMGTALAEGIPVQISGPEHYIKAYHKWTCSGAPIINEDGKILGTLDLTGYSELVHPHTLGMVVAATNAISSMMKIKASNDELLIAKKHIETIVDSIDGGIFTADLYGDIKTVNKHIIEMFGYQENEIKNMKVWDFFVDWKDVKHTLTINGNVSDEDVYVNARNNKLQFNLNTYPVLDHKGSLREVIYAFKEIKKVRKLAHKIMGHQAIYTFDKIIGRNEVFLHTISYAKKVADSKSTILITGESGTGKEIFAQSIHNNSDRRNEPFIAMNCGAIPRTLIESELFGYEEGAFTGAKRGGNPGKFEIADGGSIFLDEIGELPIDMQANFLRVIEEGVVSRIGSSKQIPVNIRIIAATNKDLKQEVANGNFRKDLYYRLNVLPIYLPPLRERRDDIPLLVEYFMKIISKRLNKKKIAIPQEYMDYLMNYEWHGNIRELENVVELMINTQELPLNFHEKRIKIENHTQEQENPCLKLERVEHRHILQVLKKFKGNISLAAEALGIGRNTLYRKIEKYQIDCSVFEQCSQMEQPS